MSEIKGVGGRRPRRSDSSAGHLERLRANKAKLDADKVEREQREEAALAKLAASWSRIESLEREREDKVADLQRQIEKVRAEFASRIEEIRTGQIDALVDLHAAGRTADEVAMLAELPKERVRRILREVTKANRAPSAPAPKVEVSIAPAPPSSTPSTVSSQSVRNPGGAVPDRSTGKTGRLPEDLVAASSAPGKGSTN